MEALRYLSKEDFRLLHPKIQLARARSGQILVKEGMAPPGLFIVRQGSVVIQRNVNSYAIKTATLGPNEIFGETAFLNPHSWPATATASAAEECDLILFKPERLLPLFDEHPGLFARFFQSIAFIISRRLRAFNEQAGGIRHDRFGNLPNWEIL